MTDETVARLQALADEQPDQLAELRERRHALAVAEAGEDEIEDR